MARRFDHIDLRVPDLRTVGEFYRNLLPALGFEEEMPIAGWLQYCARGEGATEFFGVTESPLHASNENRIAFRASDTSQVDRIARLLHRIGAKNIEGPACEGIAKLLRGVLRGSRRQPARGLLPPRKLTGRPF